MERVALGGAAVKDKVAGNRALGHMDGGAGGAAEGDRGCDVADGGAGNMRAARIKVLAVDVDLTAGHGGGGSEALEMRGRGVGSIVVQKRAKRGHSEV